MNLPIAIWASSAFLMVAVCRVPISQLGGIFLTILFLFLLSGRQIAKPALKLVDTAAELAHEYSGEILASLIGVSALGALAPQLARLLVLVLCALGIVGYCLGYGAELQAQARDAVAQFRTVEKQCQTHSQRIANAVRDQLCEKTAGGDT